MPKRPLSDQIVEFIDGNIVAPARSRRVERVTIRAGDVHHNMGLKSQLPAVCSVLGSDKFQRRCRVKRVSVQGPTNGANALFTFEILP